MLEGAALPERTRCLNLLMVFQKVAEGVNGFRSEKNLINDSRLFFPKIFLALSSEDLSCSKVLGSRLNKLRASRLSRSVAAHSSFHQGGWGGCLGLGDLGLWLLRIPERADAAFRMMVSSWLYLSVVKRIVSLVLLKGKSESELEKEAQSALEILHHQKKKHFMK